MLDLLALQFHGCRPVSDNADRFLETDTLQGSLSWYCVTDILGCPPRFLRQQTNKRHEVHRGCTLPHDQDKVCSMWKLEENLSDSLKRTHTHTPNTDTKSVCLHCSSTEKSSSAAAGVCADWFPTLGGTRSNAAAL